MQQVTVIIARVTILSFLSEPRSPPFYFGDMKLISKKLTRAQSHNPQHTLPCSPKTVFWVLRSQKVKIEAEKVGEVGRDTCVHDAKWVVDTAWGWRSMAGEGRGRSPDLRRRHPCKGIRSRFPVHCMFMTCNQTGWKAGHGFFNPQVPQSPSVHWAELVIQLERMTA